MYRMLTEGEVEADVSTHKGTLLTHTAFRPAVSSTSPSHSNFILTPTLMFYIPLVITSHHL